MQSGATVLILSIILGIFLSTGRASGAESVLVHKDVNGRLVYTAYTNQGETNVVNTIPDFSCCGYMDGGVAIPDVPVVLTVFPQPGDDTQIIQTAINSVSARTPDVNGFRGALLLKSGRYQVSNTLNITASGVILRGEGQDVLGPILEATTASDYDVISVGSGSAGYGAQSGTTRTITTPYVPVGATSFEVSSTSGYAVGNWIVIQRTPNQFWIDDLNMAPYGWTPSGYDIEHERYIVGIAGNTITVDIPLVDVIQNKYGGGRIYKPQPITRINRCGVENLRLESCYANDVDENHPWDAIKLQYVEDSWVRDVTAQYFAYSCVNVGSYSRYVTIQDCAFLDPKSVITGGRRYSFNIESTATRILFQRCYSHESRHDFVAGSRTRGPNAFVDCFAAQSHADAGPHHRWSTGILFDNVYTSNTLAVENRKDSGSGHGWSGANIVFWNCQANTQKCDTPKGAMNFAIGSYATKTEGSWAPEEPFGWWECQWQTMNPRSLYYQQLVDRLGQAALENVTTQKQRDGRIWDEIVAWKGKDCFQPCPIDSATPADQRLEAGHDVTFEVIPLPGAVVLEYQWYEVVGNNYLSMVGNSPILVIPNVQLSDEDRTFFCRVITDRGPYWSRMARIYVLEAVPPPVAWWKFDETSGTTAADSSGHNHNGTVAGTPQWVAGKVNGALDFDGSTNYVNVDDPDIVVGSFSLALWTKPRNLPYTTGYRSFLHNDVWNAGAVHVHLRSVNSQFNLDINGGVPVNTITALQADQWCHLAATVDAAGRVSKVYVNGVLDNTATGTGTATPHIGPMNIGAYQHNSRYFNGVMDDIRIYDYALTANQIAALLTTGDINGDGIVNFIDFSILGEQWQSDGASIPSADIAPAGGDGIVNFRDLKLLAENWLQAR